MEFTAVKSVGNRVGEAKKCYCWCRIGVIQQKNSTHFSIMSGKCSIWSWITPPPSPPPPFLSVSLSFSPLIRASTKAWDAGEEKKKCLGLGFSRHETVCCFFPSETHHFPSLGGQSECSCFTSLSNQQWFCMWLALGLPLLPLKSCERHL